MRSKIDQELLRLGAPTGRLGYVQMAMTLELIMQEEQVTSTTRVLYPKVAERCNTKPARIERNVREEIKAIWNFGNQKRLDQLGKTLGIAAMVVCGLVFVIGVIRLIAAPDRRQRAMLPISLRSRPPASAIQR